MTFTMQFTAQNIIRGVVNFIFNKENVPYFNDLATNCRHYIMKHTLMGKQNKALILVYTKRQKHIYPIRKHETTRWDVLSESSRFELNYLKKLIVILHF